MVRTVTNTPMEEAALSRRTQFLHDYGALLALWSEFEFAIEVKAAQLSGLTPTHAAIIFGDLPFGKKAAILGALLFEAGDTDTYPKVIKVVDAAQRNSLVHSIVASEDDISEFGFVKRKLGPAYTVKRHTFTEDTFHDHFLKFRQVYHEAMESFALTLDDLEEYGRGAKIFPQC